MTTGGCTTAAARPITPRGTATDGRSDLVWDQTAQPQPGSLGGSLAYDYGFNVETAGDSPVWHPSEVDVFPADKA